ncbi:MAG: MoxR family ATPase [Candidatus Gracilibacteria bacterium]|nr:MoxR family ATPase [Candidatus Gracilibacteria bacterium]
MNPALTHIRETILSLESSIHETIIGQDMLVRNVLISLFAGGHILLEGVPGLGKTLTMKTLAETLDFAFKRISFTPDLLPMDLIGTEVYDAKHGTFSKRKGPIFTHILLADEINRTPPKVQSALLEAMEEHQVTIGDETMKLDEPFFVIATQNPLEHEGTYPLPEAELDRFMMKIIITYPDIESEKQILATMTKSKEVTKKPQIEIGDFCEMRDYIREHVLVSDVLIEYVSNILDATRKHSHPATNLPTYQPTKVLSYGASTRAGIALIRTAQVLALLEGRDYILPEDVKTLAHDILRHRIGLSYESQKQNKSTDDIISAILDEVKVP